MRIFVKNIVAVIHRAVCHMVISVYRYGYILSDVLGFYSLDADDLICFVSSLFDLIGDSLTLVVR